MFSLKTDAPEITRVTRDITHRFKTNRIFWTITSHSISQGAKRKPVLPGRWQFDSEHVRDFRFKATFTQSVTHSAS
jgi:hypothetical protein